MDVYEALPLGPGSPGNPGFPGGPGQPGFPGGPSFPLEPECTKSFIKIGTNHKHTIIIPKRTN